jgi:hypothetical protein
MTFKRERSFSLSHKGSSEKGNSGLAWYLHTYQEFKCFLLPAPPSLALGFYPYGPRSFLGHQSFILGRKKGGKEQINKGHHLPSLKV